MPTFHLQSAQREPDGTIKRPLTMERAIEAPNRLAAIEQVHGFVNEEWEVSPGDIMWLTNEHGMVVWAIFAGQPRGA